MASPEEGHFGAGTYWGLGIDQEKSGRVVMGEGTTLAKARRWDRSENGGSRGGAGDEGDLGVFQVGALPPSKMGG